MISTCFLTNRQHLSPQPHALFERSERVNSLPFPHHPLSHCQGEITPKGRNHFPRPHRELAATLGRPRHWNTPLASTYFRTSFLLLSIGCHHSEQLMVEESTRFRRARSRQSNHCRWLLDASRCLEASQGSTGGGMKWS